MEVTFGFHKVARHDRLAAFDSFMRGCEVLSFDVPAASLAGRIDADLEKLGTPINPPDVMIAAIAIDASLQIATGNTAHFEAVKNAGYEIAIENWK